MEHVVGRHPGAVAVAIEVDDDCRSKQVEIDKAVASVDQGEGVVVVTDMFGSTPSNLAMDACRKTPNRRVLHGANLPLLGQARQGAAQAPERRGGVRLDRRAQIHQFQ